MKYVCQYDRLFGRAAILLLFGTGSASTITPSPSPAVTPIPVPSNGTCEFRTINYITDTLPQQCLKSAWSANATSLRGGEAASTAENGDGRNITTTATDVADPIQPETTIVVSTTISGTPAETDADLESGELDEASFLSFEEWKKQTLDKEKESGSKKSGEGFQNHLDSLDDSELEVDFSGFKAGGRSKDNTQNVENETEERRDERDLEEKHKKRDQYRSKDAGKTCKERFSYASFDAGATVLKTHKGAKNAKSVLIENKDSYMLSECSEENKFIIIELSEDIWIDTLVLANYEFFSSMIRTFRVSVSDRYPVPLSKWKDIGTYEARNSRDIQAFLIENPQIWARYIRIEFLSHFGNEYYCPLSLVRVHGTRMLESWKMEGSVEEEEEEETEEIDERAEDEGYIPEAVAQVVKEEEERLKAAAEEVGRAAESLAAEVAAAVNSTIEINTTENTTSEVPTTSWEKPGFYTFGLEEARAQEDVCLRCEAPKETVDEATHIVTVKSTVEAGHSTSSSAAAEEAKASVSTTSSPQPEKAAPESPTTSPPSSAAISAISNAEPSTQTTTSSQNHAKANVTTTSNHKNKTATTTSSSSSSLPTIQESFFKAVSRRLTLLESNSTLSLAYISEQSKFLREAFTKVEKKQLQKTTQFLDTLNTTVLAELRVFRQQYDEIWQSTIISLESQREESKRELLAVTERLGILGEEVVWQRRMSIVQSVLLLLCLGLVIFTRVSSSESLPFHISRHRTTGIESPIEEEWLEHGQRSEDDTSPSRDLSRSPPTPYERELTPPSEEVDDTINQNIREDSEDAIQRTFLSSPNLEIPNPLRRTKSTSSNSYISISPGLSPANSIRTDPSPQKQNVNQSPQLTPTRKKRKNSIARKRGMSQSSTTTATPPLSSTISQNPFNVLSSPSPSLKSKKSQLQTPESTPDPEVVAHRLGGDGANDQNRKFSIARKPLPALPLG